MVSEAWKSMSSEERLVWDEMARKDRIRYNVEAANYKGPWKVIAKRARKPKDAPKRPMSAFLAFSNMRRMEVMKHNPDLNQAQISALLSKMWNEASDYVRETHISQELEARERYKKEISAWREEEKRKKIKTRSEREEEASDIANAIISSNANEQLNFDRNSCNIESNSHLRESMIDRDACTSNYATNLYLQDNSVLSDFQNIPISASIAMQQETLQKLADLYVQQQEMLQNQILAMSMHQKILEMPRNSFESMPEHIFPSSSTLSVQNCQPGAQFMSFQERFENTRHCDSDLSFLLNTQLSQLGRGNNMNQSIFPCKNGFSL
jgi:HMG (high mobility group) box/HMG-box domain